MSELRWRVQAFLWGFCHPFASHEQRERAAWRAIRKRENR